MTQIIQPFQLKEHQLKTQPSSLQQKTQSLQQKTPTLEQNNISNNNIKKYLRFSNETDPQYLRYCSEQQLISRLQHKLTVLRFVFDLHQSVINKQYQRCQRVGLINQNNIKKQQCSQQQKNHSNQKRLKNLLMDDIFHQDNNKLQLIKSQLQQSVKFIIKHFHQIKRNPSWINNQISSIKAKVQSYHKSYRNQSIITADNFQNYLSSLYQYLFVQIGDIDLYDCLKQILQRWICGHYQLQQQRYQRALNCQSSLLNQTSKVEEQTNIPIKNLNCQQQTFLMKLQQQRTRFASNLMFSSAILPMDNLIKPCCTNFLYQYSQIPSNKFHSNPRSHQIIFITKLNTQKNEVSFKDYQPTIKYAIAALLNNQGGFIFIGFKKIGLYYTPQSPFLISQDSIKIIRKKLQQLIGKEITLLTAKNEKQQIPYNKFTVDFIPIFKNNNKSYNDDRQNYKATGDKGDFFWRITVLPDNKNKLKIHSLKETFYDFDRQNQTYVKITDTTEEKDRIYKKLKEIQSNYDRFNRQKPLILANNSYKLVYHFQKCLKPLDSFFVQKYKQLDTINIKNTQSSLEQNKKKLQKIPPKAQQQKIQESKKQVDFSQVDFRQVNLIILQNKNIKQRCERYFEEHKIQVKIQKIQSDYLKKLSKQTYIIYHHKKFDEINNQLNEFKKGYNSKKNISLISAQKSVYVEGRLDHKTLMEIQRMVTKQIANFQQEYISYVQQMKDNKQKAYLKANSKLGGIYLYFILSEMSLKPKIKNVPTNLVSGLMSLRQIISVKENQCEYKGRNNVENNNYTNYSQQTINKGVKNNNNNKNNSNYANNNVNYPNNNANYPNNNYNYTVEQTKSYYINFFINSYNSLLNYYQNQPQAISQFYLQLNQNHLYSQPFYMYGINKQPFFIDLQTKYYNIHGGMGYIQYQ